MLLFVGFQLPVVHLYEQYAELICVWCFGEHLCVPLILKPKLVARHSLTPCAAADVAVCCRNQRRVHEQGSVCIRYANRIWLRVSHTLHLLHQAASTLAWKQVRMPCMHQACWAQLCGGCCCIFLGDYLHACVVVCVDPLNVAVVASDACRAVAMCHSEYTLQHRKSSQCCQWCYQRFVSMQCINSIMQ